MPSGEVRSPNAPPPLGGSAVDHYSACWVVIGSRACLFRRLRPWPHLHAAVKLEGILTGKRSSIRRRERLATTLRK
jgi:hypothetical protein